MAITTSGKDKILRYARLYVGGYDLSGDSRNFSSALYKSEEIDVTGWDNTVRGFAAKTRKSSGLSGYQAIMNDAAGRAFAVLKDSPNTSQLSLLFGGGGAPATGDPAYLLGSVQLSDVLSIDAGLMVLTADFMQDAAQVDAYAMPFGDVLHGATQLSATTNASSIDTTASHANGGQALLHITQSSGGTWALKVQHSSDDSSWADLITFSADGSAVTSERGTAAGTINRYIRFQATRTSGTVTPIVTFALVLNT